MEFQHVDPAAFYATRVARLEEEYLANTLALAEVQASPLVTGEAEQAKVQEIEESLVVIENAHSVAVAAAAAHARSNGG